MITVSTVFFSLNCFWR